jgi:hypothetical protein
MRHFARQAIEAHEEGVTNGEAVIGVWRESLAMEQRRVIRQNGRHDRAWRVGT